MPKTPHPETTPHCQPCLVLHKFHDLDKDGVRDFGEPPLEGVPFDIVADGQTHHRVTDGAGEIRICFPEPLTVSIHELPNQMGGVWSLTTPLPTVELVGCETVHLTVGNARIDAPATGAGPASHSVTASPRQPRTWPALPE